jgi:hypothetical protein
MRGHRLANYLSSNIRITALPLCNMSDGLLRLSGRWYFHLHEVGQLVSIYQDPALVHGEDTYTKDTVHPVVRARSLELQSGEPLHLILSHASTSRRADIHIRTRFEDAFRDYIDVVSIVGLKRVSGVQLHDLYGDKRVMRFQVSYDLPLFLPSQDPSLLRSCVLSRP